jgi:enterochelin esterase-like enzyme
VVSPEVHPDSRVTFRLRAPNAKEVRVRLETVGSRTMQKDGQGVWSFTTDPLEPDIYAYSFTVDGVQMIDPSNPLLKYNLLNTESQVHVPGPATLAWEINDVPHGVLHRHLYRSAILGDDRPFVVYTPPGYDPAGKQTYPVLYLLHGFSDAEDAWVSVGRANVILDNLIAQAGPNPCSSSCRWATATRRSSPAAGRACGNRRLAGQHPQVPRCPAHGDHPAGGEGVPRQPDRELPRDRRPVDGRDPVAVHRPQRPGPLRLDRRLQFRRPGRRTSQAYPAASESINSQLRLLWIACGQQDGLIGMNRKLVEWLQSKGVQHTWVETPGAHSFMLWRRYLADFAPLLFHDKS